MRTLSAFTEGFHPGQGEILADLEAYDSLEETESLMVAYDPQLSG
jgi:hypothetical protein